MPGASVAYRPPQQTKRRRKRRLKPWAKLFLVICVIVALIGLWSLVSRLLQPGSKELHPAIQGVRDQISISEAEDIQAALLDGVTAVDPEDPEGRRFPVQVYIYNDEGGIAPQSCPPGTYRVVYLCESGSTRAEPAECVLTVLPSDAEGPVITGAEDLFVEVGSTVSYRSGVTAVDAVDGPVQLQVDAGEVNLNEPGIYHVTYSAADSSGNTTQVVIALTVYPASTIGTGDNQQPSGLNVTQNQLDNLADGILSEITTSNMTKREKARAIYDYVYSCVTYVGTSDKSSWVTGAYVGFTQGRGDCFNYFACSKELLTRAGIPNIDLSRTGGTTDHYWQLVNVGDGWYHFDACPHPNSYPLQSFLLTEAEVRDYTQRCSSVRKNYYVYDYDACPVTVEGTPAAELPASPSTAPEFPNPSGGKVGQTEEPPVTPAPEVSGTEPSPDPNAEPSTAPDTKPNAEPDTESNSSIPDPDGENTPSEELPEDPFDDLFENPTDDLFEDPSADPAEDSPPEPENNPSSEDTGE